MSIDIKIDSFPSNLVGFTIATSSIAFSVATDVAGINGATANVYTGARHITTLDISSIAGSYYIGWIGAASATIYNFWLE